MSEDPTPDQPPPDTVAARASILAAAAEAQNKLNEIIGVASQAVAAGTKINDAQAVIATKSDHIENAQQHADRVRADLDRALTAATQQVTASESQRAVSQAAAERASVFLEAILKQKTDIEAEGNAIKAIGIAAAKAQEQVALVEQECNARRQEAEVILNKINGLNDRSLVAQQAIEVKANEAQKTLSEVVKNGAEVESTLAAAKLHATAAEAQGLIAQNKATESATLLADVNRSKEAVALEADSATVARKSAEDSMAAAKLLADKAENIEQRINIYEKRLAELEKACEDQLKTISDLLPGATSAGLAHSFNKQKARFKAPQARWLTVFVSCIFLLILVAAPSFISAIRGTQAGANWGEVWLGMALRGPIVIPLVWLAIYAGRNYMLSLRLEEDYAYKEAISIAFEGYKREMKGIETGDAKNPSPLTKLCLNVLSALAERPGRIYDGKQRDFSILGELREAAENADDFRKTHTAGS